MFLDFPSLFIARGQLFSELKRGNAQSMREGFSSPQNVVTAE